MNIERIVNEEIYHFYYPQHRGELTLDKVIKRIKNTPSLSTKSDLFTKISKSAYQELIKFSSPEDIMDNVYWHGTGGFVSGGLQAGFNIVRKDTNAGGGGYGEEYHSISLSKNKNQASNFTGGVSRYGKVYPVLLRKGAKVEEMPHIQDSVEIEDILVDLWLRKVDAVKIGEWNDWSSEQELVVLNPKAVLKFEGEGFSVFNKKRFENPSIDVYKAIYDTIRNNPSPKTTTSKEPMDLLTVQYPQQQQQVSEEVLNEKTYRVYHGTNEKFDKFDLKKTAQGVIWFSDSKDTIINGEHGGQGNKYILTRDITINNPAGWNEYEKYSLGELVHMGYDGVILPSDDHNDFIMFSNKNIKNPQQTEEIDDSSPVLPSFGDRLRSIS